MIVLVPEQDWEDAPGNCRGWFCSRCMRKRGRLPSREPTGTAPSPVERRPRRRRCSAKRSGAALGLCRPRGRCWGQRERPRRALPWPGADCHRPPSAPAALAALLRFSTSREQKCVRPVAGSCSSLVPRPSRSGQPAWALLCGFRSLPGWVLNRPRGSSF